jgi:hypothetical protein
VIAGDADPGDHLRRRRREVALDNYITRNLPTILDVKPTFTLRFPYDPNRSAFFSVIPN